jgi:hypothetical protein
MATTKYIINQLSEQTITGDLKVVGDLSGSTIFTNSISGNTMSATTFYGDGSNLGGVVGLTYDDLGFTVTSLPSGINQDVVLPYNATVTYPTPLTISGGHVVTVPAGTTLTII